MAFVAVAHSAVAGMLSFGADAPGSVAVEQPLMVPHWPLGLTLAQAPLPHYRWVEPALVHGSRFQTGQRTQQRMAS